MPNPNANAVALAAARDHARAGRLAEAERACREALRAEASADGHALLGLILARVPPSIGAPGSGETGYIRFGHPAGGTVAAADGLALSIRPEEGKLVLFPSDFLARRGAAQGRRRAHQPRLRRPARLGDHAGGGVAPRGGCGGGAAMRGGADGGGARNSGGRSAARAAFRAASISAAVFATASGEISGWTVAL